MRRLSIREKADRFHYEANTSQSGHAAWRHESDGKRTDEKGCHQYVKPMEFRNILKDGSAEISNNLCEQRLKPVKLLLKNCMNIGSEVAAKNSAFIF